MRTGPLIFAGVAVLVLQTSVVPLLTIGGVHADLVLVVVVLSALEAGPGTGWKTGLVLGAMQDLLWGRYLGLFAGTRAVAGYAIGAVQQRLYRDNFLMPFLVCLVATWIAESLVWGALWMTGVRSAPAEVAGGIIWPASLLNGLLGVLVYRPWRLLLGRMSKLGWG